MEVVDDMKLGKIAKLSGCRSGLAVAPEVSVRWHAGLGNLVRGVTKNFFAAAGFNPLIVIVQLVTLVSVSILPFVALFFMHGASFILAVVSSLIAVCFQAGVAPAMRVSQLYSLTHPLWPHLFSSLFF